MFDPSGLVPVVKEAEFMVALPPPLNVCLHRHKVGGRQWRYKHGAVITSIPASASVCRDCSGVLLSVMMQ